MSLIFDAECNMFSLESLDKQALNAYIFSENKRIDILKCQSTRKLTMSREVLACTVVVGIDSIVHVEGTNNLKVGITTRSGQQAT
jgi:hypothetical protein